MAPRLLVKTIDEKVHPATGVVTFAIGPRTLLLRQPKEVREANTNAIPDPARRAARRSVIEHGVKAPEFGGALATMIGFLDRVDGALASCDWLSGDEFGLADAAVLPYVLRLDNLFMTPVIEARGNLQAWYERVQALPAYTKAVAGLVGATLREHDAHQWRSGLGRRRAADPPGELRESLAARGKSPAKRRSNAGGLLPRAARYSASGFAGVQQVVHVRIPGQPRPVGERVVGHAGHFFHA